MHNLALPLTKGGQLTIPMGRGAVLFVLGANGAGKSSLMYRWSSEMSKEEASTYRISAHRQNWLKSTALSLTPRSKLQTERQMALEDQQPTSRWRDSYASQRAEMAIFELVAAENRRARGIARVVDSGDSTLASDHATKNESPINVINRILRLSNLPIELIIDDRNEEVLATRQGSQPYSSAELSDGERNAILLAAVVLTVAPGTLLLIDEPERHLHRSIVSPLLTHLFNQRQDCTFIVSTHAVQLPLDSSDSMTLLLRSCEFRDGVPESWDADLLYPGVIDEQVKQDILGARRRILFIEGSLSSLDYPIYNLIYPDVSVVPKASCRDVEHAVTSLQGTTELHYLHAFGLVDNDDRPEEELKKLREIGVFALPVFSVESLYYHPGVQALVAQRFANIDGRNPETKLAEAKAAALEAIGTQVDYFAERLAEKRLRELVYGSMPTRQSVHSREPIGINLDVASVVAEEVDRLRTALNAQRLEEIIRRYPIRESGALNAIAKKLGFQNKKQYEDAVLTMLAADAKAVTFVRNLLAPMSEAILLTNSGVASNHSEEASVAVASI